MSVAIVTNPLQQMSGVMLLGEGEALSAIIVAQRSRKDDFSDAKAIAGLVLDCADILSSQAGVMSRKKCAAKLNRHALNRRMT
jgi:hypothetical protein